MKMTPEMRTFFVTESVVFHPTASHWVETSRILLEPGVRAITRDKLEQAYHDIAEEHPDLSEISRLSFLCDNLFGEEPS